MRTAVLSCCILTSGCAVTAEYPSTWPKVESKVNDNDCPDISGKFEDEGKSARRDSWLPKLSEYTFESDLVDIDYILITQPDERSTIIEAGVANKSGQVHELLKDVDFTCEDGRLWLSGSFWEDPAAGGGFAVARVKWLTGFAKTSDGSLLGNMHSAGGGVFFLFGVIPIPAAGEEDDFLLWPVSE